MKKLLYALLAVLFVLVAAVLLLPSLIDWNAYKDQLASQVERATGREITVDGPVSLSVLPSPAFSAQQVTLASSDGGRGQPMAQVADLRVKIALTPLLQGRVEVEQLVLVEPRILLERTAAGLANWRFQAEDRPAGGGGAPLDNGLLGQVSLNSVRVVDGTLRYRDAQAGIDRRVTAVDGRLSAQSLSGPFRAQGSLRTEGVPLEVDGELGRLGTGGPAPYSLRVQLSDSDAHVNLGGALTTGEAVRLQGDLELRGGELSAALARITGRPASGYPAQLAQTFSAESQVTLENGVLKAQDLSLQLGDTGANGRVQVSFPAAGADPSAPVEAEADLTVQRLDLDRLLAIQREDAPQAGGADGAGGTGGSGDREFGFALPQNLRADLNLNVGAILYRDRVIRQGRANAVLADGALTLNQAMALLPGSSDLALFGTLAARDGQPVFDGRLETASDNLRGMLDWLGVAVDRVPPDRLRRMELLADLRARPGRVTLTNLDLDVDTTQVQGGVAIALRQRPGFGIGLTADKLNLDAYLPDAGDGAGEAGSSGDSEQADTGGQPPLDWLGGFDANFDLRAGQLTYAGTTAEDAKLDATLHNQALTVREARVGNLAGATVRLDGKLSQLIGLDPQVDLNVDLDVQNPPRFAGMVGLPDDIAGGIGPVALVGTVQGGLARTQVDGTLTALGGTATFQGDLEPLAAPAAFDLVLALQHDSLRALSEQAPGLGAFAREAGPLDLTARLSGTARRFQTDNLKGRVGRVKLNGPLSVDLTGDRPKLTTTLETSALPLAAFGLATGSEVTGEAPGGGSGASGSGAGDARGGGSGARWSAEPLPLGPLGRFDLDLTLSSAAIVLPDGSRLEGAELAATLNDGLLDLDRLTGTLFGGSLRANGTLDTRDTAAVSLVIDAKQVSSGPLLARAFGLQALDGPVDLQADLNAKGANANAMIQSLAGEGSLSGRVTVDPRLFLGPQAGRLIEGGGSNDGQLGQQLSNMLGDAFGAEIKISGLTRALDFVGTAFTQKRARLTGSFAAAKGVVTTNDLTLDGLEGRAETRGQANLPTWRLDATTELFRARDAPDAPFVVTRQTGPLDAPDVAITGGAFQQQLDPQALQEETEESAPPTGSPADEPAAGDGASDGDEAESESADGAADGTGSDPGGEDAEADSGADAARQQPKRAEDIIRGVLDQLQSDQ